MANGFHLCLRAGSLLVPLLLGGVAEAADWTARGNEPGWQVEVSGTAIRFSNMEGESFAIEPVPEPVRAEGIEVYSGTGGDKAFTLVAIDKICTDTMSGMNFPKAVVVTTGEQVLIGCGGDPLALLIGDWRVTDISDQPVLAGPEVSLTFDLDGSVHGNASCNRFFGSFELSGEGMAISPAGLTRMACVEDGVMEQEQRFVAALESVARFVALADGGLRFEDGSGNVVLAVRK